jgi:hypothetical protein
MRPRAWTWWRDNLGHGIFDTTFPALEEEKKKRRKQERGSGIFPKNDTNDSHLICIIS